MRQFSAKAWVGGTVVLSILMLVAAWFLFIDPVVARAAEDTVAAEQQREQNGILELEIARLQEESTHLEEYKAELAALRGQMPASTDPAAMSRELSELAATAGVTVTALQPSVPEAFVPAASATPAVTTDAAAAEDETAEAADPAADAATLSGFYDVPITITSLGSYDASVAFLRAVQQDASRLYLVSSITAVTQDDEGASAGRPATAKGDIELTITGYAFVLTDAGATPAEGSTDADEAVPVPGGEANPFLPGR